MAEYLSPGVYVEEFESNNKRVEGVGTSTAGFIGLAERGPVVGIPQLVTSFADFKRTYGGYLSESEFGEYRFLPYAVEQFFCNGGSRAYISRVAPSEATCATGSVGTTLTLSAKNPGMWGNNICVIISPASKAKTQILEVIENTEGKKYRVKKSAGFHSGDIVVFTDQSSVIYNRVVSCQDNIIEFKEEFGVNVVDENFPPDKVILTCEFSIQVKYDDIVECYENISLNHEASNYIQNQLAKSDLIVVNVLNVNDDIKAPFTCLCGNAASAEIKVTLNGGSNGSIANLSAADFIGTDNGPGKRTGIQAMLDNNDVSILAVPGVTDPNVQLNLVAHCEGLANRFAVLDIPRDSKEIPDVLLHREIVDSSYAAFYHPWLEVFDPLSKQNLAIPSSGSVMGIYARTDTTRGVHKAPANEVIRACVGLDCQYGAGEQDVLNPKGVNLIRAFPGQGIRVWGARTATSDPNWKYVNVRRLFIFVEESIKANTLWVAFEPNDEILWAKVKKLIEPFLTELWRSGALAGSSPSEAFFVDISRGTMSQDDINNGRLICVIGIAPVRPGEFVIFRITQKIGIGD